MVKVVFQRNIYVECVSKRGSLYLKRITRRAIDIGSGLYEFRYQNRRMYARLVDGRLVCDAGTLWMSTAYRKYADIAA